MEVKRFVNHLMLIFLYYMILLSFVLISKIIAYHCSLWITTDVTLADVRNVRQFKLYIAGNFYGTDFSEDLEDGYMSQRKPLIVLSKSIVALVSRPTIAEMRKPPLRMKLCLYSDSEIRSSSLSSI